MVNVGYVQQCCVGEVDTWALCTLWCVIITTSLSPEEKSFRLPSVVDIGMCVGKETLLLWELEGLHHTKMTMCPYL